MNLKNLFNSKGFTLIELLVSFVILSIFLGVVGSALQNSFVQNTRADNKLNSIYVAKNTLKYYQNQSFGNIKAKLGMIDNACPTPGTGSNTGTELVNLDNIMTLPENEKEKLKLYRVCAEFNPPSDNSLSGKLVKINIKVTSYVNGKDKDYEIKGYKRNETQQ